MAKFVAHAEYTDQELLDLLRAQLATIAATGQAYDIRGRILTRADIDSIQRLITIYEGRVNATTTGRQATNVVKFVRPQ